MRINHHKILPLLAIAVYLLCTALTPGTRPHKTSVSIHTLAPYMKANAPAPEEITQNELFEYVQKLVRDHRTPIIVTDKDGTITPRNRPVEFNEAQSIINLLSTGCKVVILSANSMKNVSTQLTSPLINRAFQLENEKRQKQGLPQLTSEIFKDLIVCTSSGSQIWLFNPQNSSYELQHHYQVDPASYALVKDTVTSIITIFQAHPMLSMSKQAQVVDTGTQLAISAIELEATQQQRNAFKLEDFETSHVFGIQKREVWNSVLREIFSSFHTGNHKLLIEILGEYDKILTQVPAGNKKRAFSAFLQQDRYSPYTQTSIIDTLRIVLGILDKNTDYIPICKKRIKFLTPDFERAQRAWRRVKKGRKPDLRKFPEISPDSPTLEQDLYNLMKFKERQLFYWQSLLNGIKDPDAINLDLFSGSIKQLAKIMEKYSLKASEFKMPFVELGGTRTIDVKFCSKGDAINELTRLFGFGADSMIYYGDEFFPNGGDATALLSNATHFVNVGPRIIADQLPPVQNSFLYTDENGGPAATASHFNRFAQILAASPSLLEQAA